MGIKISGPTLGIGVSLVDQQKFIADAKATARQMESEFQQATAHIRSDLARGLITPGDARKAGADAAKEFDAGLVGALDRGGKAGLNIGNSQAVRDVASGLKNVEENVGHVTGAYGRLSTELIGVVARQTETLRVFDQIGATALHFGGLTTGAVIAVAGAVAAGVTIWKSWHEEVDKAKEKTAELTLELQKWYDKTKDEGTGGLTKQIEAARKSIKDLTEDLKKINGGNVLSSLGAVGQGTAEEPRSKFMAWVRVLTAGDWNSIGSQLAVEIGKGVSNKTADLVKDKKAVGLGEQTVDLEKFNKEQESLYKGLTDSTNLIDKQLDSLKKMGGALSITNTYLDTNRRLMIADTGAGSEWATQAENNNRLLGLEGVARDVIAARIKYETQLRVDSAKVQNDPQAKAFIEEQVNKAYQSEKAEILRTNALKDSAAASSFLASKMREVTEIGNKNIAITTAGTATTRAFTAENDRLADSIQKNLLGAIQKFASGGITSWSSFFAEASSLTNHFVEDFQKSIEKQTVLHKQALADRQVTEAANIAKRIEQLKGYEAISQKIGAGLAAAQTGYQIGGLIGGASGGQGLAAGALGGAASGALAGAAFGPWGAVIGGLAGAAGGLLGASDAQQKAAKALVEATGSFKTSLAGLKAQVDPNTGRTLQANIVAQTASGQDLKQQIIDIWEKGGAKAVLDIFPNAHTMEDAYRAIDSLTQQRIQQLKDEARQIGINFVQSLAVRNLTASGLVEQANTLRQQIADQKELNDAVATFGKTSAEVESLKATQNAEAVARAADAAAQKTVQLQDLGVRRVTASGGSSKQVGDMQFVLQQERELIDLRKQGVDPDVINETVKVQALEAKQREADFQQTLKQSREDSAVRALRAQGLTDEADAMEFNLQQQREYSDAVKQGLDEATLAALTLAEAAELAAFKAQQAQAAMERNNSWIQQTVDVLGLTGQEGLNLEAQNYGFSGMTPEQIRALFTGYQSGVTLTPDQIALNKNVQQYLTDYSRVNQPAAAGAAGGGGGRSSTTTLKNSKTVDDVQALTQSEGIRMADYLASVDVHSREEVKLLQSIDDRLAALGSLGGGGGPVTITMGDITVAVGAGVDRRAVKDAIAGGVDQALGPTVRRRTIRFTTQRN